MRVGGLPPPLCQTPAPGPLRGRASVGGGQMPESPRPDAPHRASRSPLLRGLGLRRAALGKLAPRRRGAQLAGNLEPPAPGHGRLQVGLAPDRPAGRRPRPAPVSSPRPPPSRERFPLSLGSGAFFHGPRSSPLSLRGFGCGFLLVNGSKRLCVCM